MPKPLFHISTSSCEGTETPPAFEELQWDLAIIGENTVDKRTKAACAYAMSHSKEHFKLYYCVEKKQVFVNDVVVTPGGLITRLKNAKRILVEATSLDCPEILYLMRAVMKKSVKEISFLYLEPLRYRRKILGKLLDHRDFDLSENSRFQSVHGFMADLTDISHGQVVFFLGFEKARLGQAIEQEEALQPWIKHAVFGVPAFESGWEIDSLSNNITQLSSSRYQVQYVSACSVEAAYNLLNELYEEDKTGCPIVVAPLGTKPHTIGTSLFLIEHNESNETILLYDHPKRLTERSEDIRRWHLYDVLVNVAQSI